MKKYFLVVVKNNANKITPHPQLTYAQEMDEKVFFIIKKKKHFEPNPLGNTWEKGKIIHSLPFKSTSKKGSKQASSPSCPPLENDWAPTII